MRKLCLVAMLLPLVCLMLCCTGCETTDSNQSISSQHGRVIRPNAMIEPARWTTEERNKDVAVRSIRVTRNASYHLICLNTAEKPHVHDQHDLVVTVLSGSSRIHLNMKTIDLRPGDVIEIPRGTLHWVENTGGNTPAEAFAVFTPPYQGNDMRLVNIPGQ